MESLRASTETNHCSKDCPGTRSAPLAEIAILALSWSRSGGAEMIVRRCHRVGQGRARSTDFTRPLAGTAASAPCQCNMSTLSPGLHPGSLGLRNGNDEISADPRGRGGPWLPHLIYRPSPSFRVPQTGLKKHHPLSGVLMQFPVPGPCYPNCNTAFLETPRARVMVGSHQ